MTTNINVDNKEIEKFNSIAASWWDLNGEFKPLHKLNPVRVAFIQEATKGVANKKGLDIGCGGGILAESLARLGAEMQGIDLAQDSLDVAKLHALEQGITNVNYKNIDAESFANTNAEQFDFVTCMEMLEHVPDPESIIAAAAKSCKTGGTVLFSTLNKTIKGYLLGIVAAEQILKVVPKGTHDYDKFIKPATLIDWAERHSLKVRGATGLHYNPITDQFSLKPGLDVNYILHFEKL